MKIYSFNEIFSRIPNSATYDYDKVREKLVAILDASGVDKKLLRPDRAMLSEDNIQIKTNAYAFPESSIDFCLSLIEKYVTKEYQALRSAEFTEVSSQEKSFIILGIISWLQDLGRSESECMHQRFCMERRMKYTIGVSLEQLRQNLDEIYDSAKRCADRSICLNDIDKMYMIDYMSQRVSVMGDYLSKVSSFYSDMRSEELEEFGNDAPSETSLEEINNEIRYVRALESDAEYQRVQKQITELIASSGLVRDKQSKYKRLSEELNGIEERIQYSLFGHLLVKEELPSMTLKHPLEVLYAAVDEVVDVAGDQIEYRFRDPAYLPDIDFEKLRKREDTDD